MSTGSLLVDRLRPWGQRLWRDPRTQRWGAAGTAVVAGLVGLLDGPVLALVLAVYGAAAFVIARGVARHRAGQRAYRLATDAVVGLAADLRAGLPVPPAWRGAEVALREARALLLPRGSDRSRSGGGPVDDGGVLAVQARVVCAIALAEAAGAPLADVLDRLEAHLRSADRARAAATSQAAGARVSAAVLAALPLAGVGLGVAVGVDPARVLLHTPLGAVAVGVAAALQLGGLAWTARLARVEVTL